MAAIFEVGVWTLVRDFAVFFSNLKVVVKVELIDINSEERKCEDCRDRPLEVVDAAHEANSFRRSTRDGERCVKRPNMLKMFVFCGFTVSPLRVSFICFL